MVAIGVPRSWNLSLSPAPIALLSLPFVAEAAVSHDGISPAKILCLGALVDVPPLKYLMWGDCIPIIDFKLLLLAVAALDHLGLWP